MSKCPRHLRGQLHVEHKDYLNPAEAAISEEQVEKMDCLVNSICDGVSYTSEELAYLLYQLKELRHRGEF